MNNQTERKHYTVKEVAQKFALTENTIRKYIKEKTINATKIMGTYYIHADEVVRFQKENCVVKLIRHRRTRVF